MKNKRCSLAPAAILFASCIGGTLANAQTPACYTVESMEGSFATIGTYGPGIAMALAVRSHDALGNLSAAAINNLPRAGSTTGERSVTPNTNLGSFTVNCDGSGVVTRIATLADGTRVQGFDDFLITEGVVENGKLVATTVVDGSRAPSSIVPGGVFLSRRYYRRPNHLVSGCYTQESLQGSYGVEVFYGVNAALAIQTETLDGKGNLSRTGVINQPDVNSPTGARVIGKVTSEGTYSVNCNGTGTISRIVTRPDGTKATAVDDFVIIGGVAKDGKIIATRIMDAQRDPSVILPGGVFVTRLHTLRPTVLGQTPTTPPQVKTVAVAGPKNVTATSRSIQLDGTSSSSADGKPLSYLWTMAQGSPQAAILGGSTATPAVQFSQGRGTYTFLLTVTDSTGATAQDSVSVDYRGN
jgi:hypothetical protein